MTIPHPGWYRVALAENREDLKDPDLARDSNCNVAADAGKADASSAPSEPRDAGTATSMDASTSKPAEASTGARDAAAASPSKDAASGSGSKRDASDPGDHDDHGDTSGDEEDDAIAGEAPSEDGCSVAFGQRPSTSALGLGALSALALAGRRRRRR